MKFILSLIIILLLLAFFIRLIENRLVYFPSKYPHGNWHPELWGLRAEDCYFKTSDGLRLHGWFVSNANASSTLLWCHGNAGNISDRLDNLARLAELPISVFIFDYRGYGRSEGQPDERGVYLDAVAAYDYLISRQDVEPDNIILFGRSLGGAVAVDLATQRPAAGLILESTFTSAKDMAKSSFGFLPVHLLIKTKFDSAEKIGQLRLPVLFFHGTEDRTVPIRLGKQLFAAAKEPKEFYEIQGADHNNTFVVGGQPYFDKLAEFMGKP